jgi:hypothetical protein
MKKNTSEKIDIKWLPLCVTFEAEQNNLEGYFDPFHLRSYLVYKDQYFNHVLLTTNDDYYWLALYGPLFLAFD